MYMHMTSKDIIFVIPINIVIVHLIVEPSNNFHQLYHNLVEARLILDLSYIHPILLPIYFQMKLLIKISNI